MAASFRDRLRKFRPGVLLLTLMTGVLSGCSGTGILNALSSEGGIAVTRDIAYGDEDRQTYDLYVPQDGDPRAAIVFYYGGSWDSGSRGMYEFLGTALAKRGFVVAIPDYRLYPEVAFPTFVEDGALAFAAIREQIGTGVPLFVMGHSAGAHIGGMIALAPRYLEAAGSQPCGTISGFIGLSGPYDFDITGRYKPIFPEATRGDSQVLPFAAGAHPPSLLIHGLDDETVEARDSELLAEALTRNGNLVQLELIEGASHTDIVAAFAWPLRFLAPTLDLVTAFVDRVSARPPYCGRNPAA